MKISLEPITVDALAGLKQPDELLQAFNQLQAEAAALLNGGLTLANCWRVELLEKEIVTPDDWVPLTPLNGFSDIGPTNLAGALAVRKAPGGVVHLRELVRRAAGAPAAFTAITLVPPAYAPSAAVRRAADANGAHGAYAVNPAGQVLWASGTPTTLFSLGGSWEAADRSLPPWEKPVRMKARATQARNVRHVVLLARTPDGTTGLQAPISCPGAYVEQPADSGETPTIVLPRIDGLQPNTRYKLSLAALLE